MVFNFSKYDYNQKQAAKEKTLNLSLLKKKLQNYEVDDFGLTTGKLSLINLSKR